MPEALILNPVHPVTCAGAFMLGEEGNGTEVETGLTGWELGCGKF
jgi:hypothetical protein